MIRERERNGIPGIPLLVVAILLPFGGVLLFATIATAAERTGNELLMVLGISVPVLLIPTWILLLKGFFIVAPNEAKVLQLFGNYVGTGKVAGLRWTNPFYTKRPVSLRVRNFESSKLKVNDIEGNPIEIASVVVWQVVDTAAAVFDVDDYENFVHVQSEAALRTLATHYPYDAHEEKQVALSTHIDEVSKHLAEALKDRLQKAGVEVIEARISHLAYAAEIASAMLRRQQASAIIAARKKIVEGAVGMVEHALQLLSEKSVVALDEERKAQMVSNLLVVLCSDHDAQPVVNTGTIYA